MAHKLKGKDLEYVALNVVEIKKAPLNKRGMSVRVTDPSKGELVMQRMKQAYAAKDYSRSPDWSDFCLKFQYVWQRDEAVNDANAALIEYFSTNDDPAPTPDPTVPTVETGTKNPGYTTYIIIGAAAAVVILLLLWDRKK